MEEEVFEALRKKKFFTPQDIHSMLILCDRLFTRNKEISEELHKALMKIDSLSSRVSFYRQTTIREIT